MKKVIKWTLYIAALAAIVLCFIFPVQAKEVCNNVMTVLNTPIVIAGITITLGGLLAFVISRYILGNTKFGRRELDEMKKQCGELKNECEGYTTTMISYSKALDNKLSDYEDKFNNLKNDCNNQVSIVYQEFADLKDKTLSALKTIPNKKVQAIVAEYEDNFEERENEIIKKTINTNEYINQKIKELEDMLNEAKETFNVETTEE